VHSGSTAEPGAPGIGHSLTYTHKGLPAVPQLPNSC